MESRIKNATVSEINKELAHTQNDGGGRFVIPKKKNLGTIHVLLRRLGQIGCGVSMQALLCKCKQK